LKKIGKYVCFLLIMLAAVGCSLLADAAATTGSKTQTTASLVTLKIDNQSCGSIKGVSGGGVSSNVTSYPTGSKFPQKMATGLTYNSATLQIGLSQSDVVYKWIHDSWNGTGAISFNRDVSITVADPKGNNKSETLYSKSLITDVTIPDLDANKDDEEYIGVTFRGKWQEVVPTAAGSKSHAIGNAVKHWFSNGFLLEIDGLDCTRVKKIDSFDVTRATPVGINSGNILTPDKLTFSNLKLTIAKSGSQTWKNWVNDYLINGHGDSKYKKNGRLILLPAGVSRDKAPVYIEFSGLGICNYENSPLSRGSEQTESIEVELFCDSMEFFFNTPPPAASSTPVASPEPSTSSTAGGNVTTETSTAQKPTDECQIGKTYSIGTLDPLNLTVNSVEYSAERTKIGGKYDWTGSDEKLVTMHYTLQNPSASDIRVGTVSIDWTLVDSNSVNYDLDGYVSVEGTGDTLDQSLSSGQSVKCLACFRIPAKGQATRLSAAAHGEKVGTAGYNLDGKVGALTARYADPGDPSGSTRRDVETGKIGEFYQVRDYDIKVDSLELSTKPILDWELPQDQAFLLMTVEYKNFSDGSSMLSGNNIEVVDQDGEVYYTKSTLALATSRIISPSPEPEATAKFRLAFRVPKNVKLRSINMKNADKTCVTIDITNCSFST